MLARENSLLANEAGENNESYTNRQNIWQGNEADNEILEIIMAMASMSSFAVNVIGCQN